MNQKTKIAKLWNNYPLFLKRFILLLLLLFIVALILFCNNGDSTEQTIRSTSLKRMVTKEDGYERIDYVDEDGTITYAADKHYATLIREKGDHTILETFLGADGKPVQQNLGHYSILRLFNQDEKEYKTIYLDMDGQPTMNRAGYAIIERVFNDEGKTHSEMYFDKNEQPVESKLSGYGRIYEYDENGRNIKSIYLGADGKPAISGNGYSIICSTYYEEGDNKGRVKNEYYYNEKEEPIKLKDGQYGLHRDYDTVGRINTYTYLGIDGMPTTTTDGYTTIIRSYYNDDSVKSDMYYDKDGLPIATSEGNYGRLRINGRTIWLDINGNEMQSFHNFIFSGKWFTLIMCIAVVIISSLINTKCNKVLLLLYSLLIIYLTLINRSESAGGINLSPFWSYRQLFTDKELTIGILNNILLFIPFATVLYNIHPTSKVIIAVIVFSILIELIQYCFSIGFCETDDVISNTFGGVTGYFLGMICPRFANITKKWIRRLIAEKG